MKCHLPAVLGCSHIHKYGEESYNIELFILIEFQLSHKTVLKLGKVEGLLFLNWNCHTVFDHLKWEL